jgi:hypothetical protein
LLLVKSATSDLSTFEDLKVTTCLAVIATSSPVFGFLPILSFLFLTIKVPNDEILTSLPSIRLLEISLKTESTRAADSFIEMWGYPEMSQPLLLILFLMKSLKA